MEQQLAQVKETLKLVSNEKDETSRQYQNYVRQLDIQQVNLRDEVCVNVCIILTKKMNRASFSEYL